MAANQFLARKVIPGILVCTVLVAVCPAQDLVVKIAPVDVVVADTRSEDYKQLEADVLAMWKEGRKAEAKEIMYKQSTDAGPADAAAAKLRLGYMNLGLNNRSEAKRLFEAVADMPSGINDAAKAEAALRAAILADNRELRSARFERMVSGEYVLNNVSSCDIAIRLAAIYHTDLRLQEALTCFDAVVQGGTNSRQVIQAKCEQVGLWMELGKGEGVHPIPLEERPAAFDRARTICQDILTSAGAETGKIIPADREMVAELMNFESYYFQDDYENSYFLGAQFLAHWGRDPGKYENKSMKIYVNTARTFHLMNCYLTGRFAESLELSEDVVASPPPASDQFASCDTLMYATVCGALSCESLNCQGEAEQFVTTAKAYSERHYDLLRPALEERRAQYMAISGVSAETGMAETSDSQATP